MPSQKLRSMIKYAGRGYRYALFEAGGIAQTLDLVSRSRGLDVVWLGGFPDQEVAKLLDLNWEMEMEAPVLLLAVGRASKG
jgi:SagB-type dehydrogenase family enzyme